MVKAQEAIGLVRDGVLSSGGENHLPLATAGNLKVASSRRGSETPLPGLLPLALYLSFYNPQWAEARTIVKSAKTAVAAVRTLVGERPPKRYSGKRSMKRKTVRNTITD